MRRLEKFARYFRNLFSLLFVVLAGNLVLIMILNVWTKSYQAYIQVGDIADMLTRDEAGGYAMPQKGTDRLDWYEAFAFLIGEDGTVLWEYGMPEELPREYSRKDIAVFTRWYLKEYPVYTLILEDGIFVVGKQKGTVWKYTMIEFQDTMDVYVRCMPAILLGNVLLLGGLPFLLARRQTYREERERSTWIAGVSHDIRTPLSLTLGAASEIRRESSEEETLQRAALIEEQTLRIRELIVNLNAENKLTYGMGKWEREDILLAPFLRELLCDTLNRGPGEQYTLEVEIAKELEQCVLRADRSLVRRLLENLIRNSIVHNPKGCYIVVRLTPQRAKKGRFAVLTVEDDGVGVTQEQLRALRRPVKWDKLSEHGLGLRVVRQIAALYRWRIRFEPGDKGGLRCQVTVRTARRNCLDISQETD